MLKQEKTQSSQQNCSLVLGLLGLLGLLLLLLDAGDAAFSDDDVFEDVVELLVLADGSQDVVGYQALLLLLLLAGLGFFEDLLDDLLEDSGHVDWGIG